MSSSGLLRRSPVQLLVLSVAIFISALLPRLGALERYVTPDELRWVDRSIHFADALSRGDWASTIQSGHPGVMTMWLGSLGIGLRYGQQPVSTTAYDPLNAGLMRQLAQYLTAARLPVILVVALNLVGLFLLLERLIDRRAAFLAAGLIAFDPFAVALGSILHVDMLMTAFSLNALAALALAVQRERSTRWFVLSGLLSGLAMLSKSPAIVLSAAAFVVVAIDGLRQRRSVWQVIGRLLIWGLSAAAIFFLLYPAMWAAPVKTVLRMRTTAENFSETAHAVNFFNGSNARDPGPTFYPVVLAFRSTPILWLGLMAGLLLLARARSETDRRLRSGMWVYGIFALLFIGVITLGAKKLDRYVLPALEALNVAGACGLAFIMEQFSKRPSTASLRGSAQDAKRDWALNAVVVVLLLVGVVQFMLVWPLPLRVYNPLLGGYANAQKVLPVGGGESAEVGRALGASPYADQWIAVSDVVGTAPYFAGKLGSNTAAGLAMADQMVFTAADLQLTPEVVHKWIGTASPAMTITVEGRPYAWLYANQWLAADQQRLARNYQTGDWLLTDMPANVAVPAKSTQVLTTEIDEAAAIDLLQALSPTHDRVWVIHYAAASRRVLD
ncbi:MAG TPA: glycosyltransferase family 39 protein, partial [Anaerolineae bacterium]|nr:glycosyltransferase family 39 protein [Anaerolineae bacterium]